MERRNFGKTKGSQVEKVVESDDEEAPKDKNMEKFERKHPATLASHSAMNKDYATAVVSQIKTFYTYNLKYIKS